VTALVPGTAASRRGDLVMLVVPADSGYLSVLRTATAGLAVRLRLPPDEIEDLRIAVDEACATLITFAAPDADVTCQFDMSAEALTVSVSVPVQDGTVLPGEGSFSWQVLSALAGDVSAQSGSGRATIRLTKRRGGG